MGINAAGYREILGLAIGDSESEAGWSAFFGQLKDRGLHGVDLVVSDDHRGLINAVHRHFQGVAWQWCQTQLKRNILDARPKRLRDELATQLRLRTTNSVERLNQEVRRRERVIRIFPNVASATRLIGALLLEQDEAWATGHRYFSMDDASGNGGRNSPQGQPGGSQSTLQT